MTHKNSTFLKAVAESGTSEIGMWEARPTPTDGIAYKWMPAAQNLHAIFFESRKFDMRRRPEMVTINGVECPAPLRRRPDLGTVVYAENMSMSTFGVPVSSLAWDESWQSVRALKLGILHETSEGAVKSAEARYLLLKEEA